MYIITESISNIIVMISDMCEDVGDRYKVSETLYVAKNQYLKVYEVDAVPEEVSTQKYCYTEDDGFYVNPTWAEPVDEIANLKAQIDTLTECILEMSAVVYAG